MKEKVTIYKDLFSKDPFYITVEKALKRIQEGASKTQVESIRETIDTEQASKLKKNLRSVCFSGEFKAERRDIDIIKHSGFVVLDFDKVNGASKFKGSIAKNKYIYAAWISPSGNGVKALVRIKDGKKHRSHFLALQDEFEGLDNSGINKARVCFESYDPEIYINEKSTVFEKTKKETSFNSPVAIHDSTVSDDASKFKLIIKWLANKGGAFVKGERNVYVFMLASACCRFGIDKNQCFNLISFNYGNSEFSTSEILASVKSAYKSNDKLFNTASFDNSKLVSRSTKNEIEIKEISPDIYDKSIKPKDVIFGIDVKEDALKLYNNGYEKVDGIGVEHIDGHFKMKKGEITLLTGIGNYGKSSFLKWYLMMRIILFGDKFAFFSPEDFPAEEFYNDMVEIYLGRDCIINTTLRPNLDTYKQAYDMVSKHIFYIYPKTIAPTPAYIKEKFLELIIKEDIAGCIIDPFNQMSNDYISAGGRSDKYLETFLSDCSRFAKTNSVFFIIVAHPKMMRKDDTGNYPCPDVFDIADGAMWNNKLDNIIVYHRPNHQVEQNSNLCEFHSKKIRRQKIVGKLGVSEFALNRRTRRFEFDGNDPMHSILKQEPAQAEIDIGDMPF